MRVSVFVVIIVTYFSVSFYLEEIECDATIMRLTWNVGKLLEEEINLHFQVSEQ